MFKSLMVVSFLLLNGVVFGNELPPMPPFMKESPKPKPPKTTSRSDTKPDAKESKEAIDFQARLNAAPGCSELPPMIIFLPPPMEKSLVTCRNSYFKPSQNDAQNKISQLEKTKIKVLNVEIMEGFRELYKITYKRKKSTKVKYCNKDITACFGS